MTELPPGWARATLGELAHYQNGRGFKKAEWSDTGRPIIRIQNLTGSGDNFNYYQGDVEDRHIVRPGDLLISWAATLGAYIWQGPEGVLNQHIFKVTPFIDKDFLFYLVQHVIEDLYRQAHGSGMVHITKGRFDAMPVMVPPLAEQQRIVTALEEQTSRLDATLSGLSASLERLQLFRECLTTQAATGGLVPDTQRHDSHLEGVGLNDGSLPKIPADWKWRRLGDVAEVVGGVTKDSKKQSDPTYVEAPFLRVANVQRGRLVLDEVTRIRVPKAKLDQLRLQPGDVLLNEGGDRDKLGRGWIWEGQIDDCIHQNHVFRARVRGTIVHPKILAWHLNGFGKYWCDRNARQTVNLASISLKKIKMLPVAVPPEFVPQEALVEEIESRIMAANRSEKSLQLAIDRGLRLRSLILKVAFKAHLAPQDPGDEPASTLLMRIRSERAATPRISGGRRTSIESVTTQEEKLH
ncbi:restriction endonuclease subunit S [Actinomadura sp. 7K507]|uniref:restriction endonuclease subunit S n=1 Tax=Actinomadura sp. 7K507 TaxID=2530365 RepID=UPI00104AF83E|nr:restriction endonuclease subunit S [Actinomadura sp. 7K507]TDC96137.1 restriction endonuclease subunit S [Actinomadura sp. 7K507]